LLNTAKQMAVGSYGTLSWSVWKWKYVENCTNKFLASDSYAMSFSMKIVS